MAEWKDETTLNCPTYLAHAFRTGTSRNARLRSHLTRSPSLRQTPASCAQGTLQIATVDVAVGGDGRSSPLPGIHPSAPEAAGRAQRTGEQRAVPFRGRRGGELEHARPCAARTLYALHKTDSQTARTNTRREFAPSVLPLTHSDVNQGSPEITRVYSTVTLGVVATPKTGTTVVGPLAARPM